MISNQITKTTYRPFALSYDSPITHLRNCGLLYSEARNADEPIDRVELIQMIKFLEKQNQHLQNEVAKEKKRRIEELSVIIKSLIRMESILKLDKKRINKRLLKNDTELFRLICINRLLIKKLNEEGLTNDDFYLYEGLQCCSCKQTSNAIITKDNSSQTTNDTNLSSDQPGADIPNDDTMSSSFNGARRCARYTSKRRFGTFNSINLHDSFDNQLDNESFTSCEENQKSSKASANNLDSINRYSSIEYDLDSESDKNLWPENYSLSLEAGPDLNFPHHDDILEAKTDLLIQCSSKNNSPGRAREYLETPSKINFETSSDNWYASASDGEDDHGVQTNLYEHKVIVNPVLECVNQILLQQSMEEPNNEIDLCPLQRTNKLNKDSRKEANNSRKRVHFSTRNSMASVPRANIDQDQENLRLSSPSSKTMCKIKDNGVNYESVYSNEYEPIGSENNSSHLYVDMEAKLGPEDVMTLEKKNPKQPPALPPKPPNLLKLNSALKTSESDIFAAEDNTSVLSEPDYCSISELNPTPKFVEVVVDIHKEQHFETDVSHKSHDCIKGHQQQEQNTDIDEIFARIAKLSNFTPTKTSTVPKLKCHVKTHSFEKISKKSLKSPQKYKFENASSILDEINKRMTTSFPTATSTIIRSLNGIPNELSSPRKAQIPLVNSAINENGFEQEKHLPIQAEFDWYNLDIEYGKSSNHQPTLTQVSDFNMIDKTKDVLIEARGVEYNLDEEFSLALNLDEINLNENVSSLMTTTEPESPKIICENFPILKGKTTLPSLKIEETGSFDKFIDKSGLSTKSLPRQRKIYCSGPFVQ